jgi:hypothetical protein
MAASERVRVTGSACGVGYGVLGVRGEEPGADGMAVTFASRS